MSDIQMICEVCLGDLKECPHKDIFGIPFLMTNDDLSLKIARALAVDYGWTEVSDAKTMVGLSDFIREIIQEDTRCK